MLSLHKHENIISLLGFCDESNEKILVYEYVFRRSLDINLNNNDLTWIRRLKICIGAARGLAYLHNPGTTQQRVLHRDIKSSNILIDENWNAKISDLGLSKFGPANQKYTFLVSNTVGTIGYCDPLYAETGLLTKESDVYSFGVVLFEVLCGRLCISNENGNLQSLTSLVRRYYDENKINEIICDKIKEGINTKSLEAFTTIAYKCLNRELEERPLMTDIVMLLEIALQYQEGGGPSTDVASSQKKTRHSQFDAILEERKRRRIISKRLTARILRTRKQKNLDDIIGVANQLKNENTKILTMNSVTTQRLDQIEAENLILRAQLIIYHMIIQLPHK
ncbi:hypothetical protein Lser_V15G22560 [Lactuca serriola]